MKLIPGKRGQAVQRGIFSTEIEVNSAGFRDREHSIEKQAGTRRVVLLGDSFLEAIQVPFDRSMQCWVCHRNCYRHIFEVVPARSSTKRINANKRCETYVWYLRRH
jgi:hypothetical protein